MTANLGQIVKYHIFVKLLSSYCVHLLEQLSLNTLLYGTRIILNLQVTFAANPWYLMAYSS